MTEEIPSISLAGRSWPVPPFVLGEQKKVVPLIYSIQSELMRNGLSEKWFEDSITLLAIVIGRQDKGFGVEAIESLGTSLDELKEAFRVICRQAGMKLNKPGDAKPGEAPAA